MEFVFYGNEKAEQKIKKYVKSGCVPQAIILTGINGIGKRTFAKEIAKMVLCEQNEKDVSKIPCNNCNSCKKINKGIYPDLYFESDDVFQDNLKTKSTKSLGVDCIRLIINQSRIIPNDGEKNIFIISSEKKMTIEAQNAFLKTLEEPNDYSIFIICCEDISDLLETVISRSVIINLQPLQFEDFKMAFEQAFNLLIEQDEYKDLANISLEDLKKIYHISSKSVGRALYIYKNNIFEKINTICNLIIKSIVIKDEYLCLKGFFMLKGNKDLFQMSLDYLIFDLQQGLKSKYIKNDFEDYTDENIKKLTKNLTKDQFMCIIDVLNQTKNNVNYNVSDILNLNAVCSEIFKILS